jgi:hypothetical protein
LEDRAHCNPQRDLVCKRTMSNSIEEQIASILESAPTVEDYLAPRRARIAELRKQLAEAKTRPKRQAIRRELNQHLRYVSQVTAGKRRQKPPSRRGPFGYKRQRKRNSYGSRARRTKIGVDAISIAGIRISSSLLITDRVALALANARSHWNELDGTV